MRFASPRRTRRKLPTERAAIGVATDATSPLPVGRWACVPTLASSSAGEDDLEAALLTLFRGRDRAFDSSIGSLDCSDPRACGCRICPPEGCGRVLYGAALDETRIRHQSALVCLNHTCREQRCLKPTTSHPEPESTADWAENLRVYLRHTIEHRPGAKSALRRGLRRSPVECTRMHAFIPKRFVPDWGLDGAWSAPCTPWLRWPERGPTSSTTGRAGRSAERWASSVAIAETGPSGA